MKLVIEDTWEQFSVIRPILPILLYYIIFFINFHNKIKHFKK